ncbi:MAG TPA: efflux RND transporter periplasmic adaptor subunit [Candidatus Eremiobacteraceae bacterium]|nr:efflux RND transporter periplasmic adaptor subunit [Candidatus Eremiobacteraceae bacterium]
MKRIYIIIAAVIVVAVLLFFGIRALTSKSATPRYLTAPVTRTDINATIQETGTVNPVNEVQVGTQVSGTINNLYVDYNSIVHKGQVLATIDPTTFQAAETQSQAAVAQAQANASASQATIAQMQASVASAQANYQKTLAALNLAQTTLQRDHSLISQGYIPQSQLDTDAAAERSAQADVNAAAMVVNEAKAQHDASQHQSAASDAQVGSAQAQLQQSTYNLNRATITSPIDGIVVSRGVSIGQTVAASFQTPTLFVIASTLKDMQVDVSVNEADVGALRAGQSAVITVPAYPNTIFNGTVAQVRVNPTTIANVVTYDAVVAIHDVTARLKPGMTANVTISVAKRPNVLTVPAAALLFKPRVGSSAPAAAPAGPGGPGVLGATVTTATPPPLAGAPGSRAVVWTLSASKTPQPVQIVIGMSDGVNFEVRSGALKEGDKVIIGMLQSRSSRTSTP